MMLGIKIAALSVTVACMAAAQSPVEDALADFSQGRYTEVLARLQNEKDDRSRAVYALAQAATGKCAAALPQLTKLVPDLPLTRLEGIAAIKCDLAADHLNEAFAILQPLEQKYPNDPDVLYLAAKLHMKGFNDATLAMFRRTPASYRVHELSAEILETQSRYGDAIAEYRKAIQSNPKAADLHFRLGRALLLESHEGKALDEAAMEFQSELRLSPEDSACEFQLGQIAMVKGNAAEGKQHMERALQLSPDFVQPLIALGKMAGREKDSKTAVALLTHATTLQPENQSAHYALMTAYRDSGDVEKAKTEKAILDKLQTPASGEFSEFLKKIGEKPAQK